MMPAMKPAVAIIGPGRVGAGLGRALRAAGYRIAAVAAQDLAGARRGRRLIGAGRACASAAEAARLGRLVLLTTPDDQIEPVCRQIARQGGFSAGQTVVHASGMLSSAVLGAARACGAQVASCHPLQSFASVPQAERLLAGTTFACEGDGPALRVVRQMVRAVGGRFEAIPAGDKVPYHLGAVFVSNYLVALAEAGVSLYEGLGLGRRRAWEALAGLVHGTVDNVTRLGPVEALTGPIARGDAGVVRTHLEWMRGHRPELVPAYRALGQLTLAIARRKGTLSKAAARRLATALAAGGRLRRRGG